MAGKEMMALLCLHPAARDGFAAVFLEHLSRTHLELPARGAAAAASSAVCEQLLY